MSILKIDTKIICCFYDVDIFKQVLLSSYVYNVYKVHI